MDKKLRDVLTSTLGRWIAAGFALILAPVTPALVNLFNNVFGVGLTDAQITDYSQTASVAIAGVVVTWLYNRGVFERKAVDTLANPDTAAAIATSTTRPD